MNQPTPRIDLHAHTVHSDGYLTPEALITRAANAGVTSLAVTDHDTISGIEPAVRASVPGVRVIAGLEATVTLHGRECHILGLLICPTSPPLVRWCESRASERRLRMERMIAALIPHGARVTIEEVIAEAGGHTLARPHLARVLVKKGYVDTVQDAFDRLLTRKDVAERAWKAPEATEVIQVIHDAGGVASIAHPGVNRVSSAEIKILAAAGLDAVEAAHPDHDPSQSGNFVRWATDAGLQWTGGSDFHGGMHINAELGAFVTPAAQWAALEARAAQRATAPALREAWAVWNERIAHIP